MDEADRCSRLAILQSGRLIACDTPTALKEKIGGDVISIVSRDPDGLEQVLLEKLDLKPDRFDGQLRIERSHGHEFVPRIIEAAPQMVDSISVGKPTLEDVFIQLTGQRFSDGAGEKEPGPPGRRSSPRRS